VLGLAGGNARGVALMFQNLASESQKTTLHVYSQRALSADPIEFDLGPHHLMMRSVLSPLVSEAQVGGIEPAIAESWEVSEDQLTWKFKIRPNLFFENGDPISAESVVRSFRRIGGLLKARGSRENLFVHLRGFETLNFPNENYSGILAEKNRVSFYLKNPMKNFLETLSFGLYSIISDRDIDSKSGEWISPRVVTASGPYKVVSWNDKSATLEWRKDFSAWPLRNDLFTRIEISFDRSQKKDADFIQGLSTADHPDLKFHATTYNTFLNFLRINHPERNPILADITTRRKIRDAFVREYKKELPKGSKIFFGLFPSTYSYAEDFSTQVSQELANQNTLKGPAIHIPRWSSAYPDDRVMKALGRAIESLGITVNWVESPSFADVIEQRGAARFGPQIDICRYSVGLGHQILATTLKFMWLSTEGVKFPDESGDIVGELNSSTPDFRKINSELWNQSLVIPYGHDTEGVWARDGIDVSQLNLALGAIDFTLVGRVNCEKTWV
jgi:hypothetical protein